jgi:hypothetical protein
MRSQDSKPQAEEPSGRYQVFAGEVTPTEQWASGDGAPVPVQVIVRSTAIGFVWSAHSTLVEKSACPPSTFIRWSFVSVVCEFAGRVTVSVFVALPVGMYVTCALKAEAFGFSMLM